MTPQWQPPQNMMADSTPALANFGPGEVLEDRIPEGERGMLTKSAAEEIRPPKEEWVSFGRKKMGRKKLFKNTALKSILKVAVKRKGGKYIMRSRKNLPAKRPGGGPGRRRQSAVKTLKRMCFHEVLHTNHGGGKGGKRRRKRRNHCSISKPL